MKKLFLYTTAILLVTGWIMPAAAMDANLFEDVQIHGFISQGFLYSDEYNYLAHNSTDGSFEYNEMGINFSKNMTDKLRIGMQFFSRDLGDVSNNKVTLDWAYGDYRFKDWLGLRAGKMKLPLGFYNETRDMDMLRTSIVMPQGIYIDLLRDTFIAVSGLGLYGNVPIGAAGSLDYQALVGSFNIDLENGSDKFLRNFFGALGTFNQNTVDTCYASSLRWETFIDGLRVGYSNFFIEPNYDLTLNPAIGLGEIPYSFDGEVDYHFFSAEYTWNNLILSGEYHYRKSEFLILGAPAKQEQESYYFAAAYQFNDLFTLGARYSVTYPDKDDKDGDNQTYDHQAWEKDLCVTLRFDINDYWVLKLEGHAVDGTAYALALENADADWTEDKWYYGAAKITFSF